MVHALYTASLHRPAGNACAYAAFIPPYSQHKAAAYTAAPGACAAHSAERHQRRRGRQTHQSSAGCPAPAASQQKQRQQQQLLRQKMSWRCCLAHAGVAACRCRGGLLAAHGPEIYQPGRWETPAGREHEAGMPQDSKALHNKAQHRLFAMWGGAATRNTADLGAVLIAGRHAGNAAAAVNCLSATIQHTVCAACLAFMQV